MALHSAVQSGVAGLEGPFPLTVADVTEVNRVFTEAFTERYLRDGLVGVRVPPLNEGIWRYAISDSSGGAMLWRGADGRVVAFNVAHLSGVEGWMGPLAVAPSQQRRGVGRVVVSTAVEWLRQRGARVIGLETMPRTMENIGFYSRLGFEPGRLTLTLTLEGGGGGERLARLTGGDGGEGRSLESGCIDLLASLAPGYDFAREIRLTRELGLGETLVLQDGAGVAGFALCHLAPLTEGRARDEARVLKLVASDDDAALALLRGCTGYARSAGVRRLSVRVQGSCTGLYMKLIAAGAVVRWSDLRMTLRGYSESVVRGGVVLSNWEI